MGGRTWGGGKGARAHQAPDAEKNHGGPRRRRHLGRPLKAGVDVEARDLRERLGEKEQRVAAGDLQLAAPRRAAGPSAATARGRTSRPRRDSVPSNPSAWMEINGRATVGVRAGGGQAHHATEVEVRFVTRKLPHRKKINPHHASALRPAGSGRNQTPPFSAPAMAARRAGGEPVHFVRIARARALCAGASGRGAAARLMKTVAGPTPPPPPAAQKAGSSA
jgi:hypothetical protein